HLHAINIVRFAVRSAMSVVLVPHVIGESTGAKYRRLVHIIPNACNTYLYQFVKQTGPPLADFGGGNIRELATAWPHMALHKIIIAAPAKIPVLLPLLKYRVIIIHAYPGVNDHNSFKAIRRQLFYHLFGVGEIFPVPGKTAVAIHVIDIEIDTIARYLVFPKTTGDLFYFRFGVIAPPALMVAQRPKWRHGVRAG